MLDFIILSIHFSFVHDFLKSGFMLLMTVLSLLFSSADFFLPFLRFLGGQQAFALCCARGELPSGSIVLVHIPDSGPSSIVLLNSAIFVHLCGGREEVRD